VKLEGPFAPGRPARGYLTYPGYENLKLKSSFRNGAERFFSFTWHPYAVDPKGLLEGNSHASGIQAGKRSSGTLLSVTESGFEQGSREPTRRGISNE